MTHLICLIITIVAGYYTGNLIGDEVKAGHLSFPLGLVLALLLGYVWGRMMMNVADRLAGESKG